ncbi:hypothetical protein LG288_11080 [Idiomarina seosinensis]|uniref:hypothetical protein n=1 Tax=Idiomarina seosinensis TaxID=281739 RepID=UPI00384AE170
MPKNLKIVALAMCLVGFSSSTMAETATDTIDVYAGLAPALELTCSDVNFGVWRVKQGNTGFKVVLATDSTFSVTGTGTGDAAKSENFPDPVAGSCTATGSAAADASTGTASITGDIGETLKAVSAGTTNYFDGQQIGVPTGSKVLNYTLDLSSTSPVITSGTATFTIGGEVDIPADIVAADHGGYVSSAIHTVTFNDNVGN